MSDSSPVEPKYLHMLAVSPATIEQLERWQVERSKPLSSVLAAFLMEHERVPAPLRMALDELAAKILPLVNTPKPNTPKPNASEVEMLVCDCPSCEESLQRASEKQAARDMATLREAFALGSIQCSLRPSGAKADAILSKREPAQPDGEAVPAPVDHVRAFPRLAAYLEGLFDCWGHRDPERIAFACERAHMDIEARMPCRYPSTSTDAILK